MVMIGISSYFYLSFGNWRRKTNGQKKPRTEQSGRIEGRPLPCNGTGIEKTN